MRFGLYLIGRPSGADRSSAPIASPDFLAPFAQHAERVGIESLFFVDHIVFPAEQRAPYPYMAHGRYPYDNDEMQIPEPLMLFAFLAGVTTTIRFGTAVLVLPQREPLLLAKQLATADRLSRGRVEIGIGAGWLADEFDALGVDFATRGRRTDEYIEVMRTVWRDRVATYHGAFVNFDAMKLTTYPVQPRGIPIVVGGHSPAALRRAGRLGDAFLPADNLTSAPVAQWTHWRDEVRRHSREAGRDEGAVELQGFGDTLDDARRLRDLGGTRMIHNVLEPDLERAIAHLDRFAAEVIEPFRAEQA
jgi:probable F420-dependent oxidoreductase